MTCNPLIASPLRSRVVFIIGLWLIGLAEPSLGADATPPDTLLHSQTLLSSRLLGQLERQLPVGSNIVISPASILALLLFMNLGADEAMQSAIIRTLGLNEVSSREAMRGLLATMRQDTGAALNMVLASAFLIDPSIQPHEPALTEMRRAGAEIELSRSDDKRAIDRLNTWIAKKTSGLITNMLDYRQRGPGLIAVSALYFKEMWLKPFPKKNTRQQPFHGLSGDNDVPMMSISDRSSFDLRTEGRFAAVDLPYAGNRFRLVVITTVDQPAKASEFQPVTDWIEGQRFSRNVAHISFPRFALKDRVELADALEALGLKKRVSSSKPFARLSDMELDISEITQLTYLKIDESGTEAAALTTITVEVAAAQEPITMLVDRPFIFGLRDTTTGLMLMAGYVARPLIDRTVNAARNKGAK
jgi:serine protease inhibitor